MPLDPALKVVLDQLAAQPGPQLHELSVEDARSFYDSMQLPSQEIPVDSVAERSIPGPAGEVPIRAYRPADAGSGALPGLVFFHGGGWVIGSLDTHDPTCRDLANQAGCVVVSVDYRLAPEARFPAAAEDCYAATCWVAEQGAAELGVDPTRLAVGGDSAGGNLASVVPLMARDREGPALRHQLLIYPVTDADFSRASYVENAEGYLLTTSAMQWFWDHYVPEETERQEAYCAPLRAAELAGLPPALVITAEFDPLRDEGEAYARRLEEAGVPTTLTRYDGMIHGFFGMGLLAEGARNAVAQASQALREALA
jgi:acetyl esterase